MSDKHNFTVAVCEANLDKLVTVNGETVRIVRGEDVTIPRKFAIVLAQGEEQDARTGALIEREAARFESESGRLGLG